MAEFDKAEVKRLTRLVWAKAGYRPSSGHWPIYGLDDKSKPLTISRGQQEIHDCESNLILATGGVRAGKSKFGAMECVPYIFVNDGLIWIIGPDYTQAENEFEYLANALAACDMLADLSFPKKGGKELTTPWGCKVQTKSSKDIKTIAGKAPHFLLGVEMGQQEYAAYEKLRERAIEHNARVVMTGTIENGLAWYPALWERWQGNNEEGGRSFSMPTWSNTAIFDGTMEDPKLDQFRKGIPEEVVLERVAAVPYKPSGLVHRSYDNKRHLFPLPFDEKLPVELGIDPASHTYAVEAIQWEKLTIEKHLQKAADRGEVLPDVSKIPLKIMREERTRIYLIDEVYEHDVIVQDMIPLVQERPWYPYVKKAVIDQAGSTRSANKSQVEVWRESTNIWFQWNYVLLEQQPPLLNLRLRDDPDMKLPTILFSSSLKNEKDFKKRATGILSEMGMYRYPQWKDGRPTTDKPINAHNDAVKALCYWLFATFGPVVEKKKSEVKVTVRPYGLV